MAWYANATTVAGEPAVDHVQRGTQVAPWVEVTDPAQKELLRKNPAHHLELVAGDVTLKDQAGRDAADAAVLAQGRDNHADFDFDDVDSSVRALALVILDEMNILRAQHSLPARTIAQLKTAYRNKLGI